jgi:hypothetical protein
LAAVPHPKGIPRNIENVGELTLGNPKLPPTRPQFCDAFTMPSVGVKEKCLVGGV